MHNYQNIAIVKRKDNGPSASCQYRGDIFDTEDPESQKRLKKVFRYLSLFDLSRSEMFFAKKVIHVEGDTEKFIVTFCCSELMALDKKYDLSAKNICVVECGGKNNIHIFMRVLNKFKIPYVVLHDIDPLDFPEDKPDKTDKEKQELRTFKENAFIRATLDEFLGRIITFNPEFENITGISKNQIEKYGKIQAAYNRYDELEAINYPTKLTNVLNLLFYWDKSAPIFNID